MNCGMDCIKYLIFIFNFVFALGGLAILVVGVLIKLNQSDILAIFEDNVSVQLSVPASVLIAVGAIIFIIAFFGCCGAARESHCMIVTFAVLLLTLLVIQVAIAAFTFIRMKDGSFEENFNKQMGDIFPKYYDTDKAKGETYRSVVNSIQSLAECCGFYSYHDFADYANNNNKDELPYSCCGKKEGESCKVTDTHYSKGCKDKVAPLIEYWMQSLGGLALGIAAVELIGVIFSFCLANSIRNVERRGYKV